MCTRFVGRREPGRRAARQSQDCRRGPHDLLLRSCGQKSIVRNTGVVSADDRAATYQTDTLARHRPNVERRAIELAHKRDSPTDERPSTGVASGTAHIDWHSSRLQDSGIDGPPHNLHTRFVSLVLRPSSYSPRGNAVGGVILCGAFYAWRGEAHSSSGSRLSDGSTYCFLTRMPSPLMNGLIHSFSPCLFL